MKKIVYTTYAVRALRRHANRAAAIRSKIEQYAVDPSALVNNVKPLRDSETKRLRVGDFRVVFRETNGAIEILAIGPRGGIYE